MMMMILIVNNHYDDTELPVHKCDYNLIKNNVNPP